MKLYSDSSENSGGERCIKLFPVKPEMDFGITPYQILVKYVQQTKDNLNQCIIIQNDINTKLSVLDSFSVASNEDIENIFAYS